MACAVGSSVALPSSIIPQVIEEGLVADFDSGSWIGRLESSLYLLFIYIYFSYQLSICCHSCQFVWRNIK